MTEPLYYLPNHRTEQQLAEMRRLEHAGICVLCPEHLIADRGQPLLHRTPHWTVTPNKFPYAGTALHLLLVPDEHVPDLLDLSAPAKDGFWAALGWVREHYALTYYGLGGRNGECRFTGGTIYHVHVHVVVGDVANPEHQPVRLRLSSRPG